MFEPRLEKVASNDSFIELIEMVDPNMLKENLIKTIEEKGLTFNQRDILENITAESLMEQCKIKKENIMDKQFIVTRSPITIKDLMFDVYKDSIQFCQGTVFKKEMSVEEVLAEKSIVIKTKNNMTRLIVKQLDVSHDRYTELYYIDFEEFTGDLEGHTLITL